LSSTRPVDPLIAVRAEQNEMNQDGEREEKDRHGDQRASRVE
jgi:hypothetical protein